MAFPLFVWGKAECGAAVIGASFSICLYQMSVRYYNEERWNMILDRTGICLPRERSEIWPECLPWTFGESVARGSFGLSQQLIRCPEESSWGDRFLLVGTCIGALSGFNTGKPIL